MSESERQYTDLEMGVILRLAAELETQALPASTGDRRRGRTLSEIEDIAAGAGIPANAIRSAVAVLDSEEPGFLARVLGAQTVFRMERFVRAPVGHPELVDLTRSVPWMLAKDGGEVQEVPGGLGWRHKTDEGPLTQIEMTRSGNGTRIRLLGNYEDPGAWTLIGGGLVAGASSIASIAALEPSIALGVGIVAGFSAVGWLGARAFWRRTAGRVNRRLTSLMDRLERQTRDVASRPGEPAMPEPPRIEPAMPAEPPRVEPATTDRTADSN